MIQQIASAFSVLRRYRWLRSIGVTLLLVTPPAILWFGRHHPIVLATAFPAALTVLGFFTWRYARKRDGEP